MSPVAVSPFPLTRPTPVPDDLFRETFSRGLICIVVALMLYPLSIVQAYMYYIRYPNDRIYIKAMVGLVSCLSTLHIACLCHVLYHYVISSYHDPLVLLDGTWTLYTSGAASAVICFLVQMFYTRLVYQLTKDKYLLRCALTAVLVSMNVMQVAIGFVILTAECNEWALFDLAKLAIKRMVPLAVMRAGSDTVTALSLTILLHRARPQSGSSGKLLHTLIGLAISRFLLTTVMVIFAMIALICNPSDIWPMALDLIFPHLYVNSCLATLNLRSHLRGLSEGQDYLTDTFTDIHFSSD